MQNLAWAARDPIRSRSLRPVPRRLSRQRRVRPQLCRLQRQVGDRGGLAQGNDSAFEQRIGGQIRRKRKPLPAHDRGHSVAGRQLVQPTRKFALSCGVERLAQQCLDLHHHLVRAGIAARRLLLHGVLDDASNLGMYVRIGFVGRDEICLANAQQDIQIRHGPEGTLSGCHEVEEGAGGKEVGARVQLFAGGLFWRHEIELALDDAGSGPLALVHGLGNPEIRQLDFPLLTDENILRTYVAMNDAEGLAIAGLAVRIGQSPADLGGGIERERCGEGKRHRLGPCEDGRKIPAIHHFQHKKRATASLPEIENLHDVAVVQAHRDVRLVHQHVAQLRILRQRWENPF